MIKFIVNHIRIEMKGDETYCVYIEKSHAVFLIFTFFIVIIIAIISESVTEACKFLMAAAIPVMLILSMSCGPLAKHMKGGKAAHKKPHAAAKHHEAGAKHHEAGAKHHEAEESDSGSESESDAEDYRRLPAKKRRTAYKGAIEDEDRFIKHGSIGSYHSYDTTTADDYMTYRAPLRNDPRREKQGTINQRRSLRKYYEDDHDENRDWWGNNDY